VRGVLKRWTPYYYSTFEEEIETADGKRYVANDSIVSDKKKIVVLGSGPNRIGQGIEVRLLLCAWSFSSRRMWLTKPL